MLGESSSSGKVAAIEGTVFRKTGHSKKAAFQKSRAYGILLF